MKNWIMPKATAVRGYPSPLDRLLATRGHTDQDARAYLEGMLPDHGHPAGMEEVASRLQWAAQNRVPMVVYGDYDVDGITSAALMVEVLESLGADVRPYLPSRFSEGYGLYPAIMHYFQMAGIKMILTVDCGIRSLEEAELAKRLGIELIILDHHSPGPEMPMALIVDPQCPGDPYPFKGLAAVGVAYHLARVLQPERPASDFLDLVALGTVADMSPLLGENRALVGEGLNYIRQPARVGVAALIEAAHLEALRIGSTEIGFQLGPRLNAAGRLETAWNAYRLLVTRSATDAHGLAKSLENLNRDRQRVTQETQHIAESIAFAYDDPDGMFLVAVRPEFNAGVVGLVAGKLCQAYYRPTIVGMSVDGQVHASCRSIPEFNITKALDECKEYLESYGGHAKAAGLVTSDEKFASFLDSFQTVVHRELEGMDLRPALRVDAEMSLDEIKPDLLDYLSWLEPTGMDNPAPVFMTRDLYVRVSEVVGKTQNHLRLTVQQGQSGRMMEAIAFEGVGYFTNLSNHVAMAYRVIWNSYINGLQLQVVDMEDD